MTGADCRNGMYVSLHVLQMAAKPPQPPTDTAGVHMRNKLTRTSTVQLLPPHTPHTSTWPEPQQAPDASSTDPGLQQPPDTSNTLLAQHTSLLSITPAHLGGTSQN
jgi:hypothetical protein